jgi:uncharacterized protein
MIDLGAVVGFDWDAGNARKNDRHEVTANEAEQVFFHQPLLLLPDPRHSDAEQRFHALGKTGTDRPLHVTFTLRGNGTLIRVISARDMNRKERVIYDQAT